MADRNLLKSCLRKWTLLKTRRQEGSPWLVYEVLLYIYRSLYLVTDRYHQDKEPVSFPQYLAVLVYTRDCEITVAYPFHPAIPAV